MGSTMSGRITVVNDNEAFLQLMHDLLTDQGFVVTALKGDHVAIEEIAATEPDLRVIDLRLGDAAPTGWDVLVMARAHRPLRNVPVIICSADIREIRRRA